MAVALSETFGGLPALGCPAQPLDFQLHQALGRKSNHLAQKVGVRALLDQGPSHRWIPRSGWCRNPILPESPVTTAKPLARYSAVEGALASGFATAELHRQPGHDHVRQSSKKNATGTPDRRVLADAVRDLGLESYRASGVECAS
jgi:hypothetical protein